MPSSASPRLPSVARLFAKKNKSKSEKKSKSQSSASGRGFGISKPKSPSSAAKPAAAAAAENAQVFRHEAPPEIPTQLPKLTDQPISPATDSTTLDNDGTSTPTSRKATRKKWGQWLEEEEESELQDAETTLLHAVFTREYQKQALLNALEALPRKLIQLSSNPLIFTVDNFIDPEACRRVQSDGSGCFNLVFPETLADNLFEGQESEMDGLLFNRVTSSDHEDEIYPDGLHMDTNGQCLFRHVTAILYLNDVPEECGGATVFPLGRSLPNDPVLAASKRLLKEKIPHTRSRAVTTAGLQEDAQLLESRISSDYMKDPSTNTVIKIQPKAGRLLIFFSRDSSGHEDPRAWHAGERLLASNKDGSVPTEKRILTLFKEVDYGTDASEHNQVQTTLEGYLASMVGDQRELLQERAGS